MARFTPLSTHEKAEIRALARQGINGRQIARRLNRSPSTVQKLLRRERLNVAQFAWAVAGAPQEKPVGAVPAACVQGSDWKPIDEAEYLAKQLALNESRRLQGRRERQALEAAAYGRRKARIMAAYREPY